MLQLTSQLPIPWTAGWRFKSFFKSVVFRLFHIGEPGNSLEWCFGFCWRITPAYVGSCSHLPKHPKLSGFEHQRKTNEGQPVDLYSLRSFFANSVLMLLMYVYTFAAREKVLHRRSLYFEKSYLKCCHEFAIKIWGWGFSELLCARPFSCVICVRICEMSYFNVVNALSAIALHWLHYVCGILAPVSCWWTTFHSAKVETCIHISFLWLHESKAAV